MVSPPTSRGAGARSYYKYVSESVNQTQIVDHCPVKQHIVCKPDPGMKRGGGRGRESEMLLIIMLVFSVIMSLISASPSPGYDPVLSLLAKYPSYSNYIISSKRNGGMPDECRGRYDTAIYTTLDNICEDCYNLYKEPDIHSMCRADCFSSAYFQNCLQALLLEEDRFVNMAQIIGKR